MIGRIIIPDRVKQRSLEGVIVEVGKNCTKVKLGDKILFGNYSGWEVPLDSYRNCLMMNEGDILGTIEEMEEEKDG